MDTVAGEEIRRKVSATLRNIDKLTQIQIDIVWKEAMSYIKTLPQEERGEFYWNSGGLECLFMFTSESKRSNHDIQ